MFRAYILSDEEIDHSETLLWSRVQGQRVEGATDTCIHGAHLDTPCGSCEAIPNTRLVRVKGGA